MPTPLLQIVDLGIDFISENATHSAVKHISLKVYPGEILAIVGESGSGKSVTSLSVLGLLPTPPAKYSSGEILFFQEENKPVDLLKLGPREMRKIRGNKIAMIFQEPMTSLNPVFSCGNQVMETIRLHKKISAKESKKQTLELFEKVKLPDPSGIFHRYPHQLSGGQIQRVMIAIAISCDPLLLICDEPTTALDVTVQKTILELIRELQQKENMGVIFITHDLGVVAEIADRALVLYKGEIVEEDSVQSLFRQPKHPYTKGLLNCRPVLHTKGQRLPTINDFIQTSDTGFVSEKIQQAYLHKGNPPVSEDFHVTMEPISTVPLLEVSNLCVWYPTKKTIFGKTLTYLKAVDDISFTVFKGETLGLVGESGSGKTSVGKSLLRLIEPSSGKIRYDGFDLAAYSPDDLKKLRKNLQIVFQDPYSSLNPLITIGSAISEPLQVHNILPSKKERKDRVRQLLEKVDLQPQHAFRYPHEFSGGQRQRIVIARALALNPSFIVCDECLSALDVSVQAQVLNLLNELKKEYGFTVIFISHDLSVVRYISDRIVVMNKGKIEETGTAEEIYHHPKKEYTQRLIASIPKGVYPSLT
jgi:peptide/nickel transport system ATP-binding protein